MYSEKEREELFVKTADFIEKCEEFEGLLQIGSGAIGYNDIYSDIDLMAGCFSAEDVISAKSRLVQFFKNLGAVYINERAWSKTVLGISVYFENGLSSDISFMPTEEIVIRSEKHKIVFAKTQKFSDAVSEKLKSFTPPRTGGSAHHELIYALRRCEIAVLRGEFIYADMALSDARNILLLIEAEKEGKDIHQFKAFNILEPAFIKKLEETFPAERKAESLSKAKEKLLSLYIETAKNFDENNLELIGCFE
ncbi:MAG: hypothetical protein IJ306_10460 [Oscillospiraceae bacterium]|nr:hypothetical protein [Oscillospiraceae bacterium]